MCVWAWSGPQRSIKVKDQDALLITGQWCLGATVLMIWAIFTFVTLKWPLQGHPRSIFCVFWKANIDFPIVSRSINHWSISHRLATIHDCNRQTADSTLPIQTNGLPALSRQKSIKVITGDGWRYIQYYRPNAHKAVYRRFAVSWAGNSGLPKSSHNSTTVWLPKMPILGK